jgi:hypothetical protein
VHSQDGHGTVLVIGEDREPDLFWALRGGTGGLGAVTPMVFRTLPVPRMTNFRTAGRPRGAAEVVDARLGWPDHTPVEMCRRAGRVHGRGEPAQRDGRKRGRSYGASGSAMSDQRPARLHPWPFTPTLPCIAGVVDGESVVRPMQAAIPA